MSTQVMRGLSRKIEELEKLLRKKNLTEWERRFAEYKLAEAKFWLFTEMQGYQERTRA